MPDQAKPRIAKELVARLPRTFAPALNQQLEHWDLLFPAEQRAIQAQMDWLAGLPRDEFDRLVAPVVEIESRMDLPRWDSKTAELSVQDAGILARSPHYPQWRSAVEKVFAQVEDGVEASGRVVRPPALVIAALPSGLPTGDRPLWPELTGKGKWVRLDQPFGRILSPLVASLAVRKPPAGVDPIEATWILECETQFGGVAESAGAVVLSWTALEAARRAFLDRLNRLSRDLKSVDRTNEELRQLDMSRLLGPLVGSKPRVREFVRSLLLSGNGSLVFNNSFVQWGAAEALRRAQPQLLVASFGIRPKIKPFSGSVLFEDQRRSNPTPDEEDPAGSLVDAEMLAQYVYLAAQRVPSYQRRSITLLAGADLSKVLILGPGPVAGPEPMRGAELEAFLLGWMAS